MVYIYRCTWNARGQYRVFCAESAEGLAWLKEYESRKAEAQEQPWQVVTELVTANIHQLSPTSVKFPLIRVSVNLEPESDRPEETRGTAVIKVDLSAALTSHEERFYVPS